MIEIIFHVFLENEFENIIIPLYIMLLMLILFLFLVNVIL